MQSLGNSWELVTGHFLRATCVSKWTPSGTMWTPSERSWTCKKDSKRLMPYSFKTYIPPLTTYIMIMDTFSFMPIIVCSYRYKQMVFFAYHRLQLTYSTYWTLLLAVFKCSLSQDCWFLFVILLDVWSSLSFSLGLGNPMQERFIFITVYNSTVDTK